MNEGFLKTNKVMMCYLPFSVVPSSLKLAIQSSQVRSDRNRYKVGSFGFLLPIMKPRWVKLTMSPFFGCHRVKNPEVPGTAVNRTPFGLLYRFKIIG